MKSAICLDCRFWQVVYHFVKAKIADKSRKGCTMKILSINSSPRTGGQSKTDQMLNNLVKGMQEAGAEVEVVNLREKKLSIVSAVSLAGRRLPASVFIKTI